MRVAVIGAGITGLSVAFHLAQGGADVLVHERTGVGAEASGVQPGGVRQQWSTRVNCLLARESAAFYRELEERLDVQEAPALEPCGYIFLAHSPERREALASDVRLQNELGIASRLIEPADVETLLPGIDASDLTGAAYGADDGYFDRPQGVIEAFADACRRHGVTIAHSDVLALSERDAGWALECRDLAVDEADAVVVAAGYDTPAVLATVGVDLPIAKEPRYLLLSEPIVDRLLEPLVVSSERHFAAKQLRNGRVLASDLAADGDPDQHAAAWRSHVKASVRRYVPVLEYVTYPIVVEGFYDVTPDNQPFVAPVAAGLWVAAGFSGHGFMIAPAVGRVIADAMLTGVHDPLLDAFTLDRFARGSNVPELQIV